MGRGPGSNAARVRGPLWNDGASALRRQAGVWVWASRPFTLTASLVPPLVGSALALAEARASVVLFLLVLAGSLLVQAGLNLLDEYADEATPAAGRKLAARYKVIARGELSRRAVGWGAAAAFSLAGAIGAYLVWVAGWPVLAVCVASLAAAVLYVAGPRPLGALALGEPLVFVFMGPVMVTATYYVHAREVTAQALLVSLPVACLVTAILVANDLRDVEEDRAAGRATPVTVLGRAFGRVLWSVLAGAAVATLVALSGVGLVPLPALLALLALPRLARAARHVWRASDRPSFVPALRDSAAVHGQFGVLLAAGLALGALFG